MIENRIIVPVHVAPSLVIPHLERFIGEAPGVPVYTFTDRDTDHPEIHPARILVCTEEPVCEELASLIVDVFDMGDPEACEVRFTQYDGENLDGLMADLVLRLKTLGPKVSARQIPQNGNGHNLDMSTNEIEWVDENTRDRRQKVQELFALGKPDWEIAEQCHCSKETVKRDRDRMGLKKRSSNINQR